ncbi:PAS domain S-box protein [Flavihumibacter sp. R14]|nr:PAS domain S-box protein [Flavihumibacter soli]
MLNINSAEAIFNALPTPCLVLLPDAPLYTIAHVNEAYCAATQTRANELLNKPAFEVFPANPKDPGPSGIESLKSSYEQVLSTKESHKLDVLKYDIPVRGTDGFAERYWRFENSPVLDEQGNVQYIIHSVTDITEQVLAEEKEKTTRDELARNREHYQSLFDHHPDAIYSCDLGGNFMSANKRSAELSECPLEDLLHSPFAPLIPRDDIARVNDHFTNACTGEIQNYNTGFITVKGNYRILNVTNLPIIVHGQIIGVYGIARDVTRELHADQKLKHSKEQLRKIMDFSRDIICIVDADGRFVKMSKASEVIWGQPPESLEGKLIFDLIHENDRETTRNEVAAIIQGNDTTRFLNRCLRKNGEIATMSWSAYWDRDDELMYCVGRDITEYITVTEKIKNNERRFRTLIKNSSEGISLVTESGSIIERSFSAMKILGLHAAEEQKTWQEIIHPDDVELGKKTMSDILADPDTCRIIECRLANSDKWVEFTFHNQLHDDAVKAIIINSRDITEKKRTSGILRSSEERYRNLFYNNPLPMWIYDTNTFNFLEVNQAAVEKYGYTEEEFLKMTIRDIRPSQDAELIGKIKGRQTKYGLRYDGHWRHLKKNGDMLYVDVTSQVIDHGGCEATLILANDITKRVRAEQATRTSEEVRTLIMNAALDSIVCMDKDGLVTLWNLQAEKLFGWKKDEILGKNLVDFIIPEQFREQHMDQLRNYKETGECSSINSLTELHALKRDQTEFPIELVVVPIKQGGASLFCAFIRDITERKHYITALDRSEKRYKAMVQDGSDLINILDHEGNYKYASPASAAMIGMNQEEVIGKSAFEYIHEDDQEMIAEALGSLSDAKRVSSSPYRFKDPGGEYRWLESIGTNLLDDPAVEGIVVNSRDITDRINHIQAIEAQNTKLREIGWIQSHLVRAPLTRIMGLADVIANYSDEDIDTRELLNLIVTSANELDVVIRDIVKNTKE